MNVPRLSIALSLALAPASLAQTWVENGDAGKLPNSAQVCDGTGALNQINGNINDPSEPLGAGNDKDIYLIRIATPGTFSATTNGGSTGDTQLFLFDENGRGVTFNDDSSPNVTSRITGTFVTAPGRYYLAISHYDRDPTGAGLAIWNDSPFTSERQPDGPGAANPIDGWIGEISDATSTAYQIFLTGCEYVTPNVFEIWSATSFTSRGTVAGAAGEVHQGWHGSHWGCIGDSGASSSIIGFTYITQDQNASTPETYSMIVRSGTDAAGPTPGVAGELGSINGLTTPAGVGTLAWQISAAFASPVAIPEKGFFSTGMVFAANAAWPADGQSLHSTAQALAQSGPHQGDHGWQIVGGVTSHPSQLRSWRIANRVLTPVLQNGVFATTTSTYAKGMGGMFPPIGTHGWSTHITAGSEYANGFAAIFIGTAQLPAAVSLNGFGGNVCITGTLVPVPLVNLSAAGSVDVKLVDPVAAYGPTTVYLQAVVVSTGFKLHFTNMNATTFQ